VVSSAESHGIKLIINFVNNWSDYGGMPAYNTYYGTNKTTWYTNTEVQTQYKAYIKAVVSRYSSSSAVFAWELANEPRCNGCPTSIVTTWATSISAYIKSLDSTHMVTLGDEGFMNGGGDGSYPYTTEEGIDFASNLKIAVRVSAPQISRLTNGRRASILELSISTPAAGARRTIGGMAG